jgi:hypothetical protein
LALSVPEVAWIHRKPTQSLLEPASSSYQSNLAPCFCGANGCAFPPGRYHQKQQSLRSTSRDGQVRACSSITRGGNHSCLWYANSDVPKARPAA